MVWRLRNNPQRGRRDTDMPFGPHAVVTTGFDDDPAHTVHLHFSERVQPDLGGALNFSYDLYALPLYNVGGPYMIAKSGFRTVTPPTAFFQQAPTTGMGGTFVGTFAYQPLLDPSNPAAFDVNDI